MKGAVEVKCHVRPLFHLVAGDIQASFAKKSNKSRFNRLKKFGKLEFRRILNAGELDKVLDSLILFYDFRQGAVHHSLPFRDDPQKREFHARLFATESDMIYLTATFLDERLLAAFWGMVSGKTVHLGILAYSPFFAEHSPGKLHLMQLADRLCKDGMRVLDFTPGGDPWKERFANVHDEVAEARIYRSSLVRVQARIWKKMLKWGKTLGSRVGLTPSYLKTTFFKVSRLRPSYVMWKFRIWKGVYREFRIYRIEPTSKEGFHTDERVNCNSLSDILLFEPSETWQTRDGFLSDTLKRLEQGELAFTIRIKKYLAHWGWMVVNQTESYISEVKQKVTFPSQSIVLYDFYTNPNFRQQGLYRSTISHMVSEAFGLYQAQYVYILVLADNRPSRNIIETLGFAYQGSYFLKRCLWWEKKWTNCPNTIL
jgi:RimJ/RimL family protein N-acetyltransferase